MIVKVFVRYEYIDHDHEYIDQEIVLKTNHLTNRAGGYDEGSSQSQS